MLIIYITILINYKIDIRIFDCSSEIFFRENLMFCRFVNRKLAEKLKKEFFLMEKFFPKIFLLDVSFNKKKCMKSFNDYKVQQFSSL